MKFEIHGGDQDAKIFIDNQTQKDGVLFFDVEVLFGAAQVPKEIQIAFETPCIDTYSVWSPRIHYERYLGPNWAKRTTSSRLASGMPLHMLVSSGGKNRMAVAVSDAKTPMNIRSGVCEENACIQWEINLFTVPVAPLKTYKATVRIDTRDIPYDDAIYDVTTWWENECGYAPLHVPEHARLPMNSLWYTYHQQLDVEDILRECVLSKALGMDTVIVDDGWQTDDNHRSYLYCGDWEVASSKIPDMKDFVRRVHQTGMKIMLWFSVPFMGTMAKNYERFRSMLLDETGNRKTYFALDPRYKEVRDYLCGIYVKAVREWGFDGLKLDFIDTFALKGKSLEYDERRDYQALEDAIDVLMTDVTKALRAVNPEILLEFRQAYVGPAIRKYGNMLRVSDCPNDSILNRINTVNLRLTSGKTAVHSDMLMWHPQDTVESAALQFVGALYSVPQISVKLATLPQEHRDMLAFELSFWRAHRDILLDGKLWAKNPESGYSTVCAEKDGKAILTSYTDPLVDCGGYSELIAVNASPHAALVCKGADGKHYRVVDCRGNTVREGTVCGALCEIEVPLAGMLFVK